jgi:hypothetical protein
MVAFLFFGEMFNMKTTFLKSLTGVTATMLLASYAGAQVANNEVEPNDNKAAATLADSGGAGMVAGDYITGISTGTSTTAGGVGANADTFRIKVAAAPLAIYRHEMTIAGTPWALTVRGLSQTGTPAAGGTIGTTDNTLITAAAVSGNEVASWYGFGKQEELYFRVTGTTSTVGAYTATMSTTPVTPVDIAGSILEGSITIRPAAANTSDMDWWLYNANLDPISGAGRDSGTPLGHLTTSLTPGTYYVAWSRFNGANNQASGIGESFFGTVLDFPNAFASSAAVTAIPQSIEIQSIAGTVPGSAPAISQVGEVVWYRFNVLPGSTQTSPNGTFSATPSSVLAGNSTLLAVNVTPGLNPSSTGLTVTADLSNLGGSPTTAFYDDGSNGDVTAGDNTFSLSYAVPGAVTAGVKSLTYTVADAEARSTGGSGSVTVVAPPAATDLGAISGTVSPAAFDLAAGEIKWFKITVPAVSTGAGNWLDLWTSAPVGMDTEIGVYTATGAMEDNDDDDGEGNLSAMSYGQTTPTRPLTNGTAFNGRDGSLAAGTYYVAVGIFNTTFGTTNWNVTSTGGATTGVQLNLQLGPVSSSPSIVGTNVGGTIGDSVLIRGTVTPGAVPASTGLAVNADLSSLGGSATFALTDDGLNGDVTAGDNIFSASYTLAAAAGTYNVPLTVTDAEARSGAGSLTVSVDGEGSTIATAAVFTGDTINGNISFGNDVDMFRVNVCDPATFTATVTGGTLADTQLFMFRADGTGVAFNDDQSASALSKIDGPIVQALTAGVYYLAITDYNTDARDSGNALIWANTPFTGVRAPDGPGAANPLSAWDTGGGDSGTYTILLTGGNGDGCVPTCPGNECGSQDYNGDGDFGTDADIEAFFACLGGSCCATCFCQGSDFNGDGDFGTDADIEAFFRVLAGGNC